MPKARMPKAVKPMKVRVLVVSGPNLDRLGKRRPDIYGTITLDEIHRRLEAHARELDAEVECIQTSHEGDIVDRVGRAGDDGFHGVVLNAGGYSHTSIAIHDAIEGAGVPCVEVHLSHPEAREPFRRRSVIAKACVGKISGFGARSYSLGLEALVGLVRERS